MPRRGAVGDHADRQRGGVRGEVENLYIDHGGQAAEPLGADTQCVDLVEDLQAQLLDRIGRAARPELVDVDRRHQRLFRQQHRLFGGAADADTEHARRAPAGAHRRQCLDHPVDDAVTRVEDGELGLVLRAAALGGQRDVETVAGHDVGVDDRRGVVFGVFACADRRVDHRGAQLVVRVQVGAAHALVDHVGQAHVAFEAHVHAYLEKHHHGAGVLTDRTVTLGTHAGVGQDLRQCVLGGR